MTVAWGNLTDRMLAALAEQGSMTRTEVCKVLGIDRHTGASVITRLTKRRLRPAGPRRVRICAWRHDAEGERRYLRAVYGLGSDPDAKKPDTHELTKAAKRRYWAARKGRALISVFHMGGALR